MVRKIPRMEKTGGHKRPLKVVVEPERDALLTKRDVANALLNGIVGLAVTVIGGLIVMVLEHCLY